MNKSLATVELITKRQRLQRFADVLRSGPGVPLHLFINLEYRDAGLTGDSVDDAQRFFDLSREELAEFSCVCGGSITNHEMAERIERLAAHSAT